MAEVLMVADNPGAIEALAPVRAHLATRASVVFAAPSAEADLPLPHTPAALFADLDPALLIAGTGIRGSRDKACLAEAERRGLTSLAIVDFWSSYEMRLMAPDGTRLCPDWVTVPDAVAAERMVAVGVPPERIRAVGMTRYDGPPAAPGDAVARGEARRRLGLETDRPLVLVLSQPIAATLGGREAARAAFGYDERDALEMIEEGLTQRHAPFQSVLKLHPRDTALARPACYTRLVPGAEPLAPWMAAADAVVGMTSSGLLDAYRNGIPTISVQPRPGRDDPLPLTRDGLVPCVRDVAALRRELSAALAAGSQKTRRRIPDWMDGGAPNRVVDLALALLAQRRSIPSSPAIDRRTP